MIISKRLHHSANPRRSKMEEAQIKTNQQIFEYISTLTSPQTAEKIWLELKAKGLNMSATTFNTRVKKMVDAGLVKKEKQAYNKYVYLAADLNTEESSLT